MIISDYALEIKQSGFSVYEHKLYKVGKVVVMKVIQVSARVDPSIKESAQKVFERQGLDMATAIKMFITKTAYEQQIPLSVQENNKQAYPDDWFSEQRIANRDEITRLAFEKSPVQDLDLSKKEDREEFMQ